MNQGKSLETSDGLKIVYSAVTVDLILTPEDSARYNIETTKHRVQLRQVVKTTYPQSRGNALFAVNEFGPAQSFDEKRVAWLDVPTGTTVEQIEERLNTLECPTLQRILDLKPILSESQLRSIESGINTKTLAAYAQDYVRRSDNNVPVLFAERPQYRAVIFNEKYVEDVDNRNVSLRELVASDRATDTVQMAALEVAQSVAPVAQTV